MKLSILLPVYNEAASLEALLRRLTTIALEKEVIAVDDCSTDDSLKILERFARADFLVVRHQSNSGKGAAVRTALTHASGDYVIIQDADNELDPNDIPRLLEPIQDGKAAVVYGARNLRAQSWGNWLGNKLLTVATNILFGTRLSDMETCYKLMPTHVMRSLNLQASSFDIEPEITAKLARAGYRIEQVPIKYQPRSQDKKLRPVHEGIRALRALIKYRFM